LINCMLVLSYKHKLLTISLTYPTFIHNFPLMSTLAHSISPVNHKLKNEKMASSQLFIHILSTKTTRPRFEGGFLVGPFKKSGKN